MVKCKNCKYFYKRPDITMFVCVKGKPHEDNTVIDCDNYAPMSNADRIRSMTDEELAMAIMCPAEFTRSDKVCDFSHDCKDCTLAWLQKESEEQ